MTGSQPVSGLQHVVLKKLKESIIKSWEKNIKIAGEKAEKVC
jgi:hypothetical protein